MTRASHELRGILDAAASVAATRGHAVWVVGGLVRDLLAGRETRDVDLVLLGEVRPFAVSLARAIGGEPSWHEAFLTASIDLGDGYRVDVVRARAEIYEQPGALPRVRPGSLHEDLYRRDFTVNTLALRLGVPSSELVDLFGGRSDLEDGLLRTLHDLSFLDDPTRIMRGLELAGRLGLEFETRTAIQAGHAVADGVFDRLSGGRLRRAMELLFTDPRTIDDSSSRMASVGIWDVISPGLRIGPEATGRLRRLAGRLEKGASSDQGWLATLLACVWDLPEADRAEVARRLALDSRTAERLRRIPGRVRGLERHLETLDSPYDRFRAAHVLGDFGRIVALACGGHPVRSFLEDEWPDLASRVPTLSGADLVARGYPEGEAIGAALEETLRAKLEARITAEEELGHACRWLDRLARDHGSDSPGGRHPRHRRGRASER